MFLLYAIKQVEDAPACLLAPVAAGMAARLRAEPSNTGKCRPIVLRGGVP